MVESSPQFYAQCQAAPNAGIYPGYFMDVTRRCNLKCKYCFYATTGDHTDPTVEELICEAKIYAALGPVILTGGEPTLRPDLIEVISGVQSVTPSGVELLTNGTGITQGRLQQLTPLLATTGNVLRINLSMHPEAEGKDKRLVQMVRDCGMKLESILCVIDDVCQIDAVVEYAQANADVIEAVRIKAATRLWAEQKPTSRIFTSDMLAYMQSKWPVSSMWWRGNKTSFFNLQLENVYYMLVSWYSVDNVDILDIACPPYYRACTGQVENIVTANIINEGVANGWLDGRPVKELLSDG